jgi:hypothetical protein
MADPWVAPDSQPGHATPPATAALGASPARTATTSEVAVPVPLRPLTIPDILDGGLRIWKLAPATVTGVAAVFVVPFQVVLGILIRDEVDDVQIGRSFTDAFEGTGDVDTGFGSDAFVLGFVTQGVALAFVTAAVATLVTGWYVGRRGSIGAAVGVAVRRTWPLLAGWVLVHLVEGLFAVLLLVPALVPMTWFAVVSPVVACEAGGPIRALRRSARLCNRRFGAVLGTCLLVVLVDAVLTFALTALGTLYVELDLPAAWVVSTVVGAGALLVTAPFVAGVATLLYLDLRVRTEGLDIELAAGRRLLI